MGPKAVRSLYDSGPGTVPLDNARSAYEGVGEALNTSASGTDGLLAAMAEAWGGLSAQSAQRAFGEHTQWVRQQAAVAKFLSDIARGAAELHRAVGALMPSMLEIEANEALRTSTKMAAVATAGTPFNSIAMGLAAAAEADYERLRAQAAAAMDFYDDGALQVMDLLLATPITAPPPIALPGGVPPPTAPDITGPLQDLMKNGPDSPYLTDGPNNTVGDGPQHPTGDGPQSTGDSGGGGGDPGPDPGPDLGPSQAGPEQGLTDLGQSLGADPAFGPGTDGYGLDYPAGDALFGTSPTSPTLAGLGGGVGSLVALGMTRGGIGSMPGVTTGFRMPGGWAPGAGTPFGASTGAPSAAPARNVPKRVSAPTARMRRRRKEEEDRPGKVFTPGEQFEVPVLERPPAIGVIEYQEDEPGEELLVDSSLVGVLDRLDDEAESDNERKTRG
ncbi:PPE domain-containing protein [Nocardia sp. X0981]